MVAEDPQDLLEKIERADVLYVAGGDDRLIEPKYGELKDLKEKLVNKVYAGSSMGAFMASESYVLSMDSQETQHVHQGLNLVAFQVLCHWDIEEEKDRKLSLLKKNSTKPIIVLEELEFVTIYS